MEKLIAACFPLHADFADQTKICWRTALKGCSWHITPCIYNSRKSIFQGTLWGRDGSWWPGDKTPVISANFSAFLRLSQRNTAWMNNSRFHRIKAACVLMKLIDNKTSLALYVSQIYLAKVCISFELFCILIQKLWHILKGFYVMEQQKVLQEMYI